MNSLGIRESIFYNVKDLLTGKININNDFPTKKTMENFYNLLVLYGYNVSSIKYKKCRIDKFYASEIHNNDIVEFVVEATIEFKEI